MTASVSIHAALEEIMTIIEPGQEFVYQDVKNVVHPKTLTRLASSDCLSLVRKEVHHHTRVSVYKLNMSNFITLRCFNSVVSAKTGVVA